MRLQGFVKCVHKAHTEGWADYWKSQGRKFCDFCKCWIADNKPSIDSHEGGKKHKENVSKRLKEIHKASAQRAKQTKKMEEDIKKMENAAMIAYLKDLENNTKDMTADRIIKEKQNQTNAGKKDTSKTSHPSTTTGTTPTPRGPPRPRFIIDKQEEIDPCDPIQSRHAPPQHAKSHSKGEGKGQGKNKGGKGKGKGKRNLEEIRPTKPVQKLWYEAISPEGYTYYWHIESNESIWEPPEEGYMTFAEQEEEVKEQSIQEQLLKQLEEEEAVANAAVLEEKRANAARERLKELKKSETEDEERKGEEHPYRRDYSIPLKSHPYGPWQTVRRTETKPVDLQLPQQRHVQLPTFEKTEPPPTVQRTFKEKMIERIVTGDSDEDDRQPATFKKRKIGNKNVRKRLNDD